MNVHIFILCYNEEVLLPHTVAHYKKYIPICNITILDNKSIDKSVEIATRLGCNIISWDSNNIMNEFIQADLKNNCWKHVKTGWVIMIDMDEWLCVTEEQLYTEKMNGISILEVKGINIIGESKTEDLSDVDLHTINKYTEHIPENKKLCFLREKINEMNYDCGAHSCYPTGIIKYSSKIYYNKHMCYLGEKYIVKKMIKCYERSHEMRKCGMDVHYTDNIISIIKNHQNMLSNITILKNESPI